MCAPFGALQVNDMIQYAVQQLVGATQVGEHKGYVLSMPSEQGVLRLSRKSIVKCVISHISSIGRASRLNSSNSSIFNSL